MKKKLLLLLAFSFLFSGCVSDQEYLEPADITLSELEKRINKNDF